MQNSLQSLKRGGEQNHSLLNELLGDHVALRAGESRFWRLGQSPLVSWGCLYAGL